MPFSANSRNAAGTSMLGMSNFGISNFGISNLGISNFGASRAGAGFGLAFWVLGLISGITENP